MRGLWLTAGMVLGASVLVASVGLLLSGSTTLALQPAPKQAAKSVPAAAPEKKKDREPLFEGWAQPQVALMITGQQMGYIEPCGCTGLANQKGGLARRHTLIKELSDKKGWKVLPIDVGGQVQRFGRQSEVKFQKTADGLRKMGYQAVAFGERDLKLAVGEIFAGANPDDKPSIFTGANVALISKDLTPAKQIVTINGLKIGIAAVLGKEFESKLTNVDLVHAPAATELKTVAAELTAEKCNIQILLAHASIEESQALAKAFPQFQYVITAGGVGEPTRELEAIPGSKSLLAQVGTKGMYVGVIGLYNNPKQPFRYQRVPLDDRFGDSPEMMQLLADYQDQLKLMGFAGLDLKAQQHPSQHKFVGTEKCGECHTKALEVWKNTSHAHATDSLVKPPNERSQIPRHFDPECLSCHVTGWEPEKFYPFESGFLGLKMTPHLQHNGCENCHGPGSAHVGAEDGTLKVTDLEKKKNRDEMKLPLAGGLAERKCMDCHDLDNSPDFHLKGAFEKYWKQVEHVGKD